ncbi:MAG: hypothetical protein JST68_13310 [Bacteroidetes bacterium]|nr:hypothetical protein [Bacteroidota bacterium]
MKVIIFFALALAAGREVIAQKAVPQPAFEVGASLYPWDVHDEGMTTILDNLTGMAGVNSVYLIAVMHEERRPFNSDHLPGSFFYIHNPARTEWMAEDSRVYFKPDLGSYGKIKPLFSAFDWLNQTDYLKIVIDSARARGLRAGVEVSHTYIPVSYLNEHPEFKQRDINDKMVDRPCPNNPDVRAYLQNLYGDIAKHYDVDYIQTCMLLFTRSDDPRDGTCFCPSCKEKAKAAGFDMEAARVILKDNPYAQPQLNQWLAFRRASTTEIYKLVTDRIHQENAAIDFRLNDLNDRSSGLTLEELTKNINSVHLSTHTEQNGYQKTDRQSRIATTLYYMGKDKLVVAGVPARLLTNPDMVRSSIKISVDAGARGVGIKHYDGATFSKLRAFRNGLSEAGVAGFKPVLGVEAEKMQLTGYEAGVYLNEDGIQTKGTGTAVAKFDQSDGVYDLIVSYADEKDGHGSLALFVDGKQKAKWDLSEDVACWKRKRLNGVKIKKGAEIKLVGVANGGESARVDFIEWVPR